MLLNLKTRHVCLDACTQHKYIVHLFPLNCIATLNFFVYTNNFVCSMCLNSLDIIARLKMRKIFVAVQRRTLLYSQAGRSRSTCQSYMASWVAAASVPPPWCLAFTRQHAEVFWSHEGQIYVYSQINNQVRCAAFCSVHSYAWCFCILQCFSKTTNNNDKNDTTCGKDCCSPQLNFNERTNLFVPFVFIGLLKPSSAWCLLVLCSQC